MLKNSLTLGRKYGAKIAAAVSGAVLGASAFAADGADPVGQILDAVTFSSIQAKVIALALLVVGIALAYKGPDLAKRIIRKA